MCLLFQLNSYIEYTKPKKLEKGDRNEQYLAVSIKKINSWLILFNDKLATNNFKNYGR